MKKRLISTVLLGVLICGLFTGCGNTSTDNKKGISIGSKPKEITKDVTKENNESMKKGHIKYDAYNSVITKYMDTSDMKEEDLFIIQRPYMGIKDIAVTKNGDKIYYESQEECAEVIKKALEEKFGVKFKMTADYSFDNMYCYKNTTPLKWRGYDCYIAKYCSVLYEDNDKYYIMFNGYNLRKDYMILAVKEDELQGAIDETKEYAESINLSEVKIENLTENNGFNTAYTYTNSMVETRYSEEFKRENTSFDDEILYNGYTIVYDRAKSVIADRADSIGFDHIPLVEYEGFIWIQDYEETDDL